MTPTPTIQLAHGARPIPALGYGLWQVPGEASATLVKTALQNGYRLIDTAEAYYNEEGVGQGIRASGIPRDQIYLTTKVWNSHHGRNQTIDAFNASLQRLGVPYIDLYLMHWPARVRNLYVETWRAMIELRDTGKVRSIGVSNFAIPHLQRIIDETGVTPAVNQVELHPYFQQNALRAFHAKHGIATQSWSPLGIWKERPSPLNHPMVLELARKHGRTPAQIILRWHLDNRLVVLSKSEKPARIQENFKSLEFHLDAEDLAIMAALDDPAGRRGPDPETAEF
ncbi:aldo/keto reductase [Cupriavidus sp. 2SB]|uniref:aldo/keto reductase n=1 Tax=Cupriavidus sp. 2SB TaxID=2502199 RepID=UPI0010F82D15|nr:aldo/keto reductase [Cupriavidus sp. 2SB]